MEDYKLKEIIKTPALYENNKVIVRVEQVINEYKLKKWVDP